jgi:hypothetical protein
MSEPLIFSRPSGTLLYFGICYPALKVLGYYQSPLAGLKYLIPSCSQKRGARLSTKSHETTRSIKLFRACWCGFVDRCFPLL